MRSNMVSRACERASVLPRNDIFRCIQAGVDPSLPLAPWHAATRQLEVERLPIRVQHQMDQISFIDELGAQRDAMRPIAPIGLIEPDAVPGFVRFTKPLVQGLALIFVFEET